MKTRKSMFQHTFSICLGVCCFMFSRHLPRVIIVLFPQLLILLRAYVYRWNCFYYYFTYGVCLSEIEEFSKKMNGILRLQCKLWKYSTFRSEYRFKHRQSAAWNDSWSYQSFHAYSLRTFNLKAFPIYEWEYKSNWFNKLLTWNLALVHISN